MATTDEVRQVRLWTADLASDPADQLLDDTQYADLINANDGVLRLAAADALDIIALSELLVSKKIRTQTLTTDGPAVSAELRALADRHRAVAEQVTWDFFDIVDTLGADDCAPERTDRWVV